MSKPIAVVTGAGLRLGQAIAVALAAAGYDLLLHYHTSQQGIEATAAACRERGAEVRLQAADLRDLDGINGLCEVFARHWARLDLLVNSAACFHRCADLEAAEEHWDSFLDLNLRAPFRLVRGLLAPLRSARGAVVNVTDIYAERPLPGFLPYCVSKAGLEMLTRALAVELAPEVRVNAVAPGAILPPAGEAAGSDRLDRVPLARWGSPADVAAAVLYLARADYVTGQSLAIDGGRSALP